jgi:uncharacterized protein (TIGR02996 family)
VTDPGAFLRAIRAAPADDTPRLVFADWLDDHDDPAWAELIRVQVELEPIHEQLDNPRRRELADRETELLARHADRWLGPVHDIAAEYPAYGPVFRRGLPESVSLSLDTFLARGGELFAACPTVREVCVYGVAGRGAELAACPHLAHVETLEIADWLRASDLTALRRSNVLDRLDVFRVWLAGIGPHDGPMLTRLAGTEGRRRPYQLEAVDLGFPGPPTELTGAFPRVVFTRPFDGRFPIAAGVGHGLAHGVEIDDQPAILGVRADGSGLYVRFDADGRYTSHHDTAAGWHSPDYLDWWRAAFGRAVRVHEFTTPRLSLRLWPASYVRDYLVNPFDRPAGVTDRWWDHRGGVLKRWLHEGRFVIEWDGREFVLDASGTVVAS